MTVKNERTYRVIDDTGELSGAEGSVVDMTVTELSKKTGCPRQRMLRRLNLQGLRKYSRLKMDPQTASRIARKALSDKMKSETLVRISDSEKKRAQEERVRKGHRSL